MRINIKFNEEQAKKDISEICNPKETYKELQERFEKELNDAMKYF